jgi:hypothetical protein
MEKPPTKRDHFKAIENSQLTNFEDFCNKNEDLLEEMKNSSSSFYFSGEGSSCRRERLRNLFSVNSSQKYPELFNI